MTWKVHYKALGADHEVSYETEAEARTQARDIASFDGVTECRAETVLPSGAVHGVKFNMHGEVSLTYAFTADAIALVEFKEKP